VARRDVIVMGASAGGVEALTTVVSALPADLAAAVLVVLHTPPTSRGALAGILDRAGPLDVRTAVDGDKLEHGVVLVAPPDSHLLVSDDTVSLSRGPRENGHRPAVDVLFRSAARTLGERVISVVLSGTLDDGAAGTVAVHQRGGLCVVQDPTGAAYPGMPQAAIAADAPDHVVPLELIGDVLVDAVGGHGHAADEPPSDLMRVEVAVAGSDPRALDRPERPGRPSGFGCPSCGGVLFEIEDGSLRRYRCRVGHAWSPESLAAQQSAAVESALWTALQSLEERAALADRLAQRALDRGHRLSANAFDQRAVDARTSAHVVRGLIERTGALPVDDDADLAIDGV
jgi:two-component system, chemotaxis family, protein-glutamate methylesterase/glutaminase